MRSIFIILSFLTLIMAENVEIRSERFEANQQELISKFLGNVIFKKGKNIIKADKVFIYFNKKKKPIKIDAMGNVAFTLYDKSGKYYKGKAKRVVYFPKKKEYLLTGDVQITQFPDQKKIYAQIVMLNLKDSRIEVKGNENKPVKMILKIEEK